MEKKLEDKKLEDSEKRLDNIKKSSALLIKANANAPEEETAKKNTNQPTKPPSTKNSEASDDNAKTDAQPNAVALIFKILATVLLILFKLLQIISNSLTKANDKITQKSNTNDDNKESQQYKITAKSNTDDDNEKLQQLKEELIVVEKQLPVSGNNQDESAQALGKTAEKVLNMAKGAIVLIEENKNKNNNTATSKYLQKTEKNLIELKSVIQNDSKFSLSPNKSIDENKKGEAESEYIAQYTELDSKEALDAEFDLQHDHLINEVSRLNALVCELKGISQEMQKDELIKQSNTTEKAVEKSADKNDTTQSQVLQPQINSQVSLSNASAHPDYNSEVDVNLEKSNLQSVQSELVSNTQSQVSQLQTQTGSQINSQVPLSSLSDSLDVTQRDIVTKVSDNKTVTSKSCIDLGHKNKEDDNKERVLNNSCNFKNN